MDDAGAARQTGVRFNGTTGSEDPTPLTFRRPIGLTASQGIIAALRADIASGKLSRSSKLPNERELAAQFGVSQPTVREAIRALDAMGLVEVRHGSGVYVAGDTRNVITRTLRTLLQVEGVGILEVLRLRALLGIETAKLAARHATEEDAEQIAAARDAINQSTGLRDLWESVLSFQVLVSASAHSPLIFAIETFLTELILQFQIDAFQDSGQDFWRLWTANVADDRDRIVAILQRRPEERSVVELQEAMSAYLSDQRSLFANSPKLATIRLSDAHSIETLSEPIFTVPDYRSIRRP